MPTRLKALYDYTAQEHDELSLVEGNFYLGASLDDDGEWWTGASETGGDSGIFPATYVEAATAKKAPKPKPKPKKKAPAPAPKPTPKPVSGVASEEVVSNWDSEEF